jgi:hypothetical protein
MRHNGLRSVAELPAEWPATALDQLDRATPIVVSALRAARFR